MKQTTSPALVRRSRVGAAFVVASLTTMLLTVPVSAQESPDPRPTPGETVDTPTPEPTVTDETPTPEPTESAPVLPPAEGGEEIDEEETSPIPDEPIRFVAEDDELPDWGFPYMLNRDPYIPTSVAGLKENSGPTCPAPPLPAATDAGSADGYTMPLRLKLSKGVLLVGYTEKAHSWGQEMPFTIQMGGLTGWITARVSLPSLQVEVKPADVQLCDTSNLARSLTPFSRRLLTPENWLSTYVMNQPDGTEFIPYPGSLALPFIGLRGMRMEEFVAQQVQASVTAVAADGSLKLGTSLTSTQTATNAYDRPPDEQTICPDVKLHGRFSTEPKQIITPEAPEGLTQTELWSGLTRDYVPEVPERQTQVYLPTRPLSGAVEGGSATIGSNWFDLEVPATGGGRCGGDLNALFYGADENGDWNANPTYTDPDTFEWWLLDNPFLTISPGLADLSLDVTVDKIGLPKYVDLPSGYGFE